MIILGIQFGYISSANELRDLAEIEVLDMSVSKLKKLDEIQLQEFAHNAYYLLMQIIANRQLLFCGALRGSYSISSLFDQILLQFAMNGTRVFELELSTYDMGNDTSNNVHMSESSDQLASELLGVEKYGDKGVFRLGNINFISPNENDIMQMDIETILQHYDKIIIKRQAQFSGKELLLKQLVTLTKCCLFSVGKKKSPRSFLKFLRDSHEDGETIVTGIFTEP